MANDLNRVLLIGRLTRDPELRQIGSGTSVCRFSIANNRGYTSGGERKEEVSFINCVAWGRQAEIINQYCRKGKQVAVDGRLQQRSWEDKEGKKQSSVEVVVEQLQMLGAPGAGGDRGGDGGYAASSSGASSRQDDFGGSQDYPDPAPSFRGGPGGGGGDPMDDDIPF